MGRKPRIEFNGALYHVIQRGNNKEYIFNNNSYKQYFISKLKEFKEVMNFEVYGYIIMDNHYHIIIRSRDVNLSTIMQRVNNDFSKYYNDILHDVTNDEEIFGLIRNGSRKRNLTEYKKLYIMKSLSANYTMTEIGSNIGISESAVCLLANKN